MENLGDRTWMKYLYAGGAAERFGWGPYSLAGVILPERGGERFRYRLFAFEAGAASPFAAINLETDLLGAWKLTAELGRERSVLASFDAPPDYESFRALAVASLAKLAPTGQGAQPGPRRAKNGPAAEKTSPKKDRL